MGNPGFFMGPTPPTLAASTGSVYNGNDGSTWICQSNGSWLRAGLPPPVILTPLQQLDHMRPDPKLPDTLGFREWRWQADDKVLQSPVQGTLWETECLSAEVWDEGEAIRGVAGIHALLVPRHWKILCELGFGPFPASPVTVRGIVERYGKYVLGTEGWRAEQVVIRELLAPSTDIGLDLEQRYPNVIVHYPDQLEDGDQSCTLEKLSKLVKGSRSPLPQLPRASSPPSPPPPQTAAIPNPPWFPLPPPESQKRFLPDPVSIVIGTMALSGVLLAIFAFARMFLPH